MSDKYLPFFRKYRPQQFSDLIGQEALVKALSNAIELNRIANAYLFCGPRGTGKTSSARIFAKSLNCAEGISVSPCQKCASCTDITNASGLDVIEIDAASNRGIDDAKELISQVQYAPINGRYKIFIIDEVHMLSKDAFNALLKTFEEPPANVIFILATTEPHKVLETIVSRCQRYDFRRITIEDIVGKLKEVAALEKIKITDDALFEIAKSSNGGMRDSLALLDQVAVLGLKEEITREEIESLVGKVSFKPMFELTNSILKSDTEGALNISSELLKKGSEPRNLTDNLIDFLKNAIIVKSASNPEVVSKFTTLVKQDIELLDSTGDDFSVDNLSKLLDFAINFYKNIKSANNPYIWLELLIIQASCGAYKALSAQTVPVSSSFAQPVSLNKVSVPKQNMSPVQEVQTSSQAQNTKNQPEIQKPQTDVQVETQPKAATNLQVEQSPKPQISPVPKQITQGGVAVWDAILASIQNPLANGFFKQVPQIVKLEGDILTIGFNNPNTLNQGKGKVALLQTAVQHVLSDKIQVSLIQVPKGEKVISFPSEIEVNSSQSVDDAQSQTPKNYTDDNLPEVDNFVELPQASSNEQTDKPKNKANDLIYSDKTKNYLDVFNGKIVD
ncbi:DNA polymerase III subunit gamma/tau [bacterium]|nr:DNA polymerase III subunit gamma/tau [bacterium]